VHLALLQKKIAGTEKKNMTTYDLFRFELGKKNELKRKKNLKILCGPEAPISGFVKDQSC